MHLSLERDRLTITLEGLEKVWALKGSVIIPLAALASAIGKEPGDKPRDYWRALRMPGTFVPWVIKAGTYYTTAGKEFWYVTRGKGFLVLDLTKGPYDRVVLGVDESQEWARRIRDAAGMSEPDFPAAAHHA